MEPSGEQRHGPLNPGHVQGDEEEDEEYLDYIGPENWHQKMLSPYLCY